MANPVEKMKVIANGKTVRSYAGMPARMLPRAIALLSLSRGDARSYLVGQMDKAKADMAIHTLELLGAEKRHGILDVGAGENLLVEELQKQGYANSLGIDKAPETGIGRSQYGRIRDLFSLTSVNSFDFIHFRKILDYFEGGFSSTHLPSTLELAIALYRLLNSDGRLIFMDFAHRNMGQFADNLRRVGFKRVYDTRTFYYIWEKVSHEPILRRVREARPMLKFLDRYPRKPERAKFSPLLPSELTKESWPDSDGPTQLDSAPKMLMDLFASALKLHGIPKDGRILDVGAFDNAIADGLRDMAYTNIWGLDSNPIIRRSKHGLNMEFRDLPLEEKYDAISAMNVLDYFPGGMSGAQKPPLSVLARKLYSHLNPGGLLFLDDMSKNLVDFMIELERAGFHDTHSTSFFLVWQRD